MDILIYLIELIKTRKEIGLEGLGTFYKKKSAGRYDSETHMFLPPSYLLDFTSALKEKSNLVQFISKQRNISTNSANYFISQFVESIQKELTANGEYHFEGLGKLAFINDEYFFTPDQDINFGFDFYGLPNVSDVVAVQNKVEEPAVAEEIVTAPVPEEEKAQEESVEEETIEEEFIAPVTEEAIEEENKLEEENPGFAASAEEAPYIETEIPTEEKEEVQSTPIVENQVEESQTEDNYDWNFEDPIIDAEEPESTDPELPSNEQNQEEETFEEIAEVNAFPAKEEKTIPVEHVESAAFKEWEFDEPAVLSEENSPIFEEQQFNEELEEEEDRGMPQYLKILLGILVVLVMVIIIYFINPNLFSSFVKNDTDPDQKIAVPIAEKDNLKTQADSLSFADSIMNSAKKVGLQVDSARDTLKVTATATPLTNTTYEVISAAFNTQEQVDAYIERMKKKGIVAHPVPAMSGKMIKISVASFNNPDSAGANLKRLKKELKNSGLYIFINKPK